MGCKVLSSASKIGQLDRVLGRLTLMKIDADYSRKVDKVAKEEGEEDLK
ncbi:MAG TPA: hypothetical protein VFD87_11450 [Phototrophicaceae bacterium]|nr:hypothetical protein [Phototrophicaceae bacterium]